MRFYRSLRLNIFYVTFLTHSRFVDLFRLGLSFWNKLWPDTFLFKSNLTIAGIIFVLKEFKIKTLDI